VCARRLPWRTAFAMRAFTLRDLGLAVVGTVALHLALRGAAGPVEEILRWMRLDYAEEVAKFQVRVAGELDRAPVLVVLAITLMPALCEEALFRGMLVSGFSERLRPAAVLVVTSLAFATIHVLPVRMVLTFVLGLWFGWAVMRSGSLWCGVAAHAMNNGLALLLPETMPYAVALAVAGVPVTALCAWGLWKSPASVASES